MSNLEDVFLKINQEFAPDLFGDLKGFGERSRDSTEMMSIKQSGREGTIAKSIAHSSERDSERISGKEHDDSRSSGSEDSGELEVDLDDA